MSDEFTPAQENATPETIDTAPEAMDAEANESTAPQGPGWASKFQGLEDAEREQLQALLSKAIYTDKHGKTGEEFVLDADTLFDTVGKGIDAESKTKAAAEALRLKEVFDQNPEQVQAAFQIFDWLSANPMAAQRFAQLVTEMEAQSQQGFMPSTPAEYAMYQQLQQYQQMENQQQMMAQQQQYEAHVQEIQKQLKSDVDNLIKEYPNLFDDAQAGPTAKLNRWKLKQAAEQASGNGYYDKDIVGYAFHKAFGNQIKNQTISQYLNAKQNGAPSVGSGGRPSGGGRQNLTKDQLWERGRQRLLGDVSRG